MAVDFDKDFLLLLLEVQLELFFNRAFRVQVPIIPSTVKLFAS